MPNSFDLPSAHLREKYVPLRKSPIARAVATPLRFGPPSLDIQFADKMIVSVPGDRGGWTCAYVEREVFPEFSPA
jgi:hypothetical protein